MNGIRVLAIVFLAIWPFALVWPDEAAIRVSNVDEPGVKEGVRPYEMDWANRMAPDWPALVDFEDLTGWRVRCMDGADAKFFRSKEEKLFGEYTGKVVYSGNSAASRFIVQPSAPIPIPEPFTGVDLWVRGNNWGWIDPPATARVGVRVLVRDAKDELYRIDLGVVDFDYWFLMHATCVSPDGKMRLYEPDGTPNDGVIDFPARFEGIEINGCSSTEPAKLFFDALSFYTIPYPPLTFEPVPDVLPWPTTPDTILPSCKRSVTARAIGGIASGVWSVEASDGVDTVRYVYAPTDGTLGDVTVEMRGQRFQPCWKGGIVFQAGSREVRIGDAGVQTELIEKRDEADGCVAAWRATVGGQTFDYQYALRVRGKSLIIEVTAKEGRATQLDIGLARGLMSPKMVFFPYLTYGDDWPKTVCSEGPEGPLFLLSLMDYYHSDASELFGAPRVHDAGAVEYAGGAVYRPTTAGVRNPMRERIFINVSGDVHEVLPNIPNPDSDTRAIAREYLWRNIGHPFQNEMLSKYKGYGIEKFIACHHEVGWREAGESFTLRDRPAPGIGDEKLADYSAFVRSLGYRFGTYTNYTDFAPVNANWNADDVCLNPDGSWQRAWPRCYALKPLRAAEKEAVYAPRINERYGTTAQYCDVHTAYTPWGRTDYDARTPGAGKFRTQFDAYARLLYNESGAHKGPVFSEGNYHWFYAGIVDGDYATIVPYGRGWEFPPLADFDLLKMHTKLTDFGMGMPLMYYGTGGEWTKDRSRTSPFFDRFIASTIAFGHIGFLADEWGFDGTLKSYYLLQALQQRYVSVAVKSIRYFDGKELADTSAAIASDAYKRGQIRTEYENGLVTWCNLSFKDDWPVEVNEVTYTLPPGGFAAFKPDDILAYSATLNGQRHELVWCRDYLYLDTRGALVRTPVVTARGTVAVKPDGTQAWWIIPATKCEEASIARAWLNTGGDARFSAAACTLDGAVVGPATVLAGMDTVTVVPCADASVVKYRLTAEAAESPAFSELRLSSRTVLTTNSVPATVTVRLSAEADPAPLAILWTCGRPGSAPFKTGTADLVRSDDRQSAAVTIDLPMPAEAPLHERCWYSFRPAWQGEDAARWTDAIPLPAFDITLPAGEFMLEARKPFDMGANAISHLPGAVTATFRLDAEGLLRKPLGRQVFIKPEEVQPLIWRLHMPDDPCSAKLRMTADAAGHSVECVRYLRMRPATWTVTELTRLPMMRGMGLRGTGEVPYDSAATGALVDIARDGLTGETLATVFMHPPYKTGVGYASALFNGIALPEGRPMLKFALGFRAGSTTQDGCVFKAFAIDQGKETEVFSEQYATVNQWAPRSVDLSAYAGKTISIKLVTDIGPADNSYSDWAMWGSPRIEMAEPAWKIELRTEKTGPGFAPSPKPLVGLTPEDLANIKTAHIALETAGVNGGPYASPVFFNGIRIGTTPESSSDTDWHAATMPLPANALATISGFNTLVVKNPGGDFMKIRNICLHFELSDGRQGASFIDIGPYCSANTWPFAEGTSVTPGEDLPEIALWIP